MKPSKNVMIKKNVRIWRPRRNSFVSLSTASFSWTETFMRSSIVVLPIVQVLFRAIVKDLS